MYTAYITNRYSLRSKHVEQKINVFGCLPAARLKKFFVVVVNRKLVHFSLKARKNRNFLCYAHLDAPVKTKRGEMKNEAINLRK